MTSVQLSGKIAPKRSSKENPTTTHSLKKVLSGDLESIEESTEEASKVNPCLFAKPLTSKPIKCRVMMASYKAANQQLQPKRINLFANDS